MILSFKNFKPVARTHAHTHARARARTRTHTHTHTHNSVVMDWTAELTKSCYLWWQWPTKKWSELARSPF